jgi:predicted metal-dependent HD superfamily phosphohydrolase
MLRSWLASLPTQWTAGCPEHVFERAIAAYESPGRHYHTWQHVLSCIERLRSVQVANGRAVFLALVFHDAVYVPGRADNERLSAELARSVLSEESSCGGSNLAAVERMILATHDHQASGAGLAPDEQMMLDIDLSILGSDRETYARYASAIRAEFVPAAASDRQFRIGRLEFLERISAMPSVFLTGEGRARWEDAARANLAWEAKRLRSELGWVDRLALVWRHISH